MSAKRGLGRGLGSLISNQADANDSKKADTQASELKKLPIELIVRGKFQPRRDFDEEALEELANSIKAKGLLQPVIVRPISANTYELIAGERRWRAAQIAGLDKIPAVIKHVSDEDTAALSLIENIQREDLNSIEEAVAYQRLQDEFNLTQQDVAQAVGKSRSAIANIVRLLKLNKDVQKLLERGDLDMGHARALLALNEAEQLDAAKEVVNKSLNVRQTEALVKKILTPVEPKAEKRIDPNITQLEEVLAQRLGANVSIKHGKKSGALTIKYDNLDELEGILARIH